MASFWTPEQASQQESIDSQISTSLEKHRFNDGLIRVLRDAHSTHRHIAVLDVARVSQLDAGLINEEYFRLCREAILQVLALFDVQNKPSAEIDFLLRCLNWWFFMRLNIPSPGETLQNLRYRNETLFQTSWQTRGLLSLPDDLPTRTQRVGHLFFSVLLPFFFKRTQDRLAEEGGEQNERWLRTLESWDKAYQLGRIITFLLFLVDGRYRSITDRLLALRLVPIKNECVRSVSFELMNQQLLFDGFTQLVICFIPLVDWPYLFRAASRLKRFVKIKLFGEDTTLEVNELECASCSQRPVMPHRALPCRHVYCYYCAATLPQVSCLSCNHNIDSVERVCNT